MELQYFEQVCPDLLMYRAPESENVMKTVMDNHGKHLFEYNENNTLSLFLR